MGLPGCSPELGSKLLPHFLINRGRREEQKCSTLLVSEIHLKLVRKIVFEKKIQAEALSKCYRDISVGNFVKIFNHSSSFAVLSLSFFGLQSVSSRNQTFQFILCTLSGPHLFRVLLFSFHLLSVPPFDVL